MAPWTIERTDPLIASHFNGFAQSAAAKGPAPAGVAERKKTEPWDQIMDDLISIRTLQGGWDGLNAKAPSAELVDSAIALARRLRQLGMEAPCRVVPGLDGTVLLEWQGNGVYMEAEVTRPYFAECMKIVPGQPAEHWEISGG